MDQPTPNYTPGQMVHWVQAEHALEDMASFERLSLSGAGGKMILGADDAGATVQLSCAQAERLRQLIEGVSKQGGDAGRCGPFLVGGGWLALLSRRWHLLAVPVGPQTNGPPRRLEILRVFNLAESGEAVETVPNDQGMSLALFSVVIAAPGRRDAD